MKLRIRLLSGLAVLLISLAQGRAGLIPLPPAAEQARADALANGRAYAFLFVNGNFIDLSANITHGRDNDLSYLSADITAHGARTMINLTMDADPFVSFGATTINLVPGATTFAFTFGTPVVPGLYNQATSTGGVSVTNGAGGTTTVNNSTIYPTYISGYGSVGQTLTNLGVDNGTGAVVAAGVPFTVTTARALGTVSNTFAPTFYDNLEALLTYTQDDLSSTASWSGAVTLNIPEPAAIAILGMCAIALGSRRRSR